MSDEKLRLVKTLPVLTPANNFWKVCPRKLEYLPESCCDLGKPTLNPNNGKVQEEPECPWWLNSEKHNYCFWKYVHDKSDRDGVMEELVQSQLAELFGWSNTKTHFMLKQAIEELTSALVIYGAMDLLKDMDDEGLADMMDVDLQIEGEDDRM